jgi:threonine/homoserine/homoserine lactone efflux protein
MDRPTGIALLSAMITPAVLISACGTLIFSTSTRVARIVDRVRRISAAIEELATKSIDFHDERRLAMDRQLSFYTKRARLIQRSLTSFYSSLGFFVGTTLAISTTAFFPRLDWLPNVLGVVGAIVLFYGCVLLIREARLAFKALDEEMHATLALAELYRKKQQT